MFKTKPWHLTFTLDQAQSYLVGLSGATLASPWGLAKTFLYQTFPSLPEGPHPAGRLTARESGSEGLGKSLWEGQ